jgi:hypothetical protein
MRSPRPSPLRCYPCFHGFTETSLGGSVPMHRLCFAAVGIVVTGRRDRPLRRLEDETREQALMTSSWAWCGWSHKNGCPCSSSAIDYPSGAIETRLVHPIRSTSRHIDDVAWVDEYNLSAVRDQSARSADDSRFQGAVIDIDAALERHRTGGLAYRFSKTSEEAILRALDATFDAKRLKLPWGTRSPEFKSRRLDSNPRFRRGARGAAGRTRGRQRRRGCPPTWQEAASSARRSLRR